MPMRVAVRPNLYKDSVALMRMAQRVEALEGVRRATLVMGTPANRELLVQAGLSAAALAAAKPADLMIALEGDSDAALDAAMHEVSRLLEGPRGAGAAAAAGEAAPRSLAAALGREPGAALAQVSVPGPYAAAEAMKALRRGLHVFLFSDNVPLEQELALKKLAREKNLLVMGPDCGTAILGGVPIGFANVVRRGAIGLIGASGTGLQEVSCQIHALGHGVRHAIGTGGRDLSDGIGGVTTLQAIDALAADPQVRVIGIVSKPPGAATARRVVEHARAAGKPCVLLFLGAELGEHFPEGVVAVSTLQDAAAAAVAAAEGRRFTAAPDPGAAAAEPEAARLAPTQRYLRGLYSGGTFAAEAAILWRGLGLRLGESGHSALDLGADEFTVGRPHPMIDPALRLERIAQAAVDPRTAALVLDVVLGYAAHEDPAGALAPAIARARAACARQGRYLPVVSFVCGTEEDPQRRSAQEAKLREAGALVLSGSTAAARLAAAIAARAGG